MSTYLTNKYLAAM